MKYIKEEILVVSFEVDEFLLKIKENVRGQEYRICQKTEEVNRNIKSIMDSNYYDVLSHKTLENIKNNMEIVKVNLNKKILDRFDEENIDLSVNDEILDEIIEELTLNILLIGNGFDLLNELPTKYIDFMNFIKDIQDIVALKNGEIYSNENINTKVKDCIEEYKYNEDMDIFINKISETKTNFWISYFLDKIEGKKMKGDNWIDFEKEISIIIKVLEEGKFEKIQKNGIKTCEWFVYEKINSKKVKGRKLTNILEKDLKKFIDLFEDYVKIIINKIPVTNKFDNKNKLKINKILSFNYSDTYERIYSNTEVDYIHGKAGEKNIVLGIDEYLENEDKNKNLECIFFKKYFQRIYNKTGAEHKKWLEYIKLTSELEYLNHKLYIVGHSLDITDKEVLSEFILENNIKTTVYYYTYTDDNGKYNDDDYRSKISNLVRVIEQDNVIKKVYGKNPSLVFKNLNEIK